MAVFFPLWQQFIFSLLTGVSRTSGKRGLCRAVNRPLFHFFQKDFIQICWWGSRFSSLNQNGARLILWPLISRKGGDCFPNLQLITDYACVRAHLCVFVCIREIESVFVALAKPFYPILLTFLPQSCGMVCVCVCERSRCWFRCGLWTSAVHANLDTMKKRGVVRGRECH